MNKSKFLKRSLATLLAILMVVAMVPMSAFAAAVVAQDVPTARDVADPGYEIALNGIGFTWNGSGYETTFSFVNDNSGTSPTVQLSMTNKNTKDTTFVLTDTNETLTLNNLPVKLSSAKIKNLTDAYGSGTYEFTLETRKELGDKQEITTYPLIVKATVRQRDNDTRVLAVRSGKMSNMADYDIEYYENGGGKVTIYMTLNTDLTTATSDATNSNNWNVQLHKTGANSGADVNDLREIFTVSPSVRDMALNNGELTVIAENGHTDTYDIVLKHEAAFKTFALEDDDGNVYEGKIDNDNPKRIIIDLPYDKFYVDQNYNASGPSPDIGDVGNGATSANNDIIAKIERLKATWTTSREEAIVQYDTAYSGVASTSGKVKLEFANNTTNYTAPNTDDLNENNGIGQPNYLIFTTKRATPSEGGSNRTTKGLFVDTKSRLVDHTGTDQPHCGEVEIIVRVPKYNPSTDLEGIQIKGIGNASSDGTNENGVPAGGATSSEQWSQYIVITGDQINITVPKDVLKLGPNQNKESEESNKRAFIKLWGAYGAKTELPWDFVNAAKAGAVGSKIDSNGFETDSSAGDSDSKHGVAYDDTLAGTKTGATTQSDSSILLTETNNNRTTVKTVAIDVTSQDGNNTRRYYLRVNEQGATNHATELKSVKLYDGDHELVAEAQPSSDGNYTIEVPYAVGSGDGGTLRTGYYIEAVAQDGGRISYAHYAKESITGNPLGANDFVAFVKSAEVKDLTNNPAKIIARQLTDADKRIQSATDNVFTLRVWDDSGITAKGVYTDHTIEFVMPDPKKDQRISSAVVMADNDNDNDGVKFPTTVDNNAKTITVTLPYAYKYLNLASFAELKLDGLGTRMYYDGASDLDIVVAGKSATDGPNTQFTTNSTGTAAGVDYWLSEKDHSIKLYVMSEEAYSRLMHGWSNGGSGSGANVNPDTIDEKNSDTIANLTKNDSYTYYTAYKLTAVYETPERGNTLTSIESTNKFVQVERDTSAGTITVTVPKKYANNSSIATAAAATSAKTAFNLSFTTDSDKARLYMWENNTSDTSNTTNVQTLNDGIPAQGVPEFISATNSNAIVPTGITGVTPTTFWVTLEGADKVPTLHYTTDAQSDNPTKVKTEAYEAIVAAEYTNWTATQELGGTRPYKVITKIANAETDPAITSVTVGGHKASLYENAETGEAIWTVSLPYGSKAAQQIEIETAGKFTDVKIDNETFDPEAYYIVNTYDDVSIVSTPESGSVHKTYTLRVVNGDADSNTNLSEVRVDGYTATLGDNGVYTVAPADTANLADMSLTLRAASDKIQGITVNSVEYTAGMKVDLSGDKTVTIVVTAENGNKGTYTLTVGTAPVKQPADDFTDLGDCSSSLRNEVTRAINMGIVKGTGDNKYSPMANVQRRSFAVMIARADLIASGQAKTVDEASALLAGSYKNSTPFTDIASLSNEEKAAIEYCYTNKYITGTSSNAFSPSGTMTREMAATVITRWSGKTVDENDKTNHTNFTSDWNRVSDWAKPYINSVATTGLMNGTGATSFTPKGNVTREMAAALIVRVFDQKYPNFNK